MILGLKTWRALLAVSYRSIEEHASQENILSTFLDSEYNYLHILEYKMTPVLSKGGFDEILKSDSRFTFYSSGYHQVGDAAWMLPCADMSIDPFHARPC